MLLPAPFTVAGEVSGRGGCFTEATEIKQLSRWNVVALVVPLVKPSQFRWLKPVF